MWVVRPKKIKLTPEICPSQQAKLLTKGTMSSQFDRTKSFPPGEGLDSFKLPLLGRVGVALKDTLTCVRETILTGHQQHLHLNHFSVYF